MKSKIRICFEKDTKTQAALLFFLDTTENTEILPTLKTYVNDDDNPVLCQYMEMITSSLNPKRREKENWKGKIKSKINIYFEHDPESLALVMSFLDKTKNNEILTTLETSVNNNDDDLLFNYLKIIALNLMSEEEKSEEKIEEEIKDDFLNTDDSENFKNKGKEKRSAFSSVAEFGTNGANGAMKVLKEIGKEHADDILRAMTNMRFDASTLVSSLFLAKEAYENINLWYKGEISGKRCVKNILDSAASVGGGIVGAAGGAAIGSLFGPGGIFLGK